MSNNGTLLWSSPIGTWESSPVIAADGTVHAGSAKPDLQQRLWPYRGGIARENKMKALVVGGVEDHVHVLLSIPSTLSVAKATQLLKGNFSKWIHDAFKEHWAFEWQEGCGAFSIGISGVEDTTKYIQGQEEHHRKMTFKEELEVFLKKHGMEFAERDLER